MEKFTATSDPYTGVHAFFPNQVRKAPKLPISACLTNRLPSLSFLLFSKPTVTGLVPILKLVLLTPIIFLLRLPFILLFGTLLFSLDAAVSLVRLLLPFNPLSSLLCPTNTSPLALGIYLKCSRATQTRCSLRIWRTSPPLPWILGFRLLLPHATERCVREHPNPR